MKHLRTISLFKLLVLALVLGSLTACHFHGYGHHGSCYRPPVRHCR